MNAGPPTTDPFANLPSKDRTARSARILDQWVSHASRLLGAGGQRTGWILASAITMAALQRAHGDDGAPLFLLKGGVYLERSLPHTARATQDVDTLFRGSIDQFLVTLDTVLTEPWGPLTLARTEIEVIDAPRLVKPRRFDVLLRIEGVTWRRIQVEASFGDGHIGEHPGRVTMPQTAFFGIQAPPELATIAMNYQVAQKLHACTDPHDPPAFRNTRVRDIVDLTLIRDAFYPPATSLTGLVSACHDIFTTRAVEAERLNRPTRSWPPTIRSNPEWERGFTAPATQAGLTTTLPDTIDALNRWIEAIHRTDDVG